MNALHLMLSVAFLVGVSSFPRTPILDERPVAAVYLIPQDQLVPLLQYALPVDNPQQLNQYTMPEEEYSQNSVAELDEHSTRELSEEPAFGVRSRRSTQPGAPAPQGGNQQGGGDRGSVSVDVSRSEGGGRRVDARGEGNVWQSRDGRGRVDVHGHYSRDYGGRYGTGRPQYGGGVRYSHRF